MLYDLYEKKMKRRYYIKTLLFKYKVFIICITSLLSLLLMTFLLTKGIIYDVNYTKHVRYGNSFEISSKGMFTDIRYKFSKYNQNEWASETPTTPGRYEVKVISNKPFNKQNEKKYQFTIYPKQVNLTIDHNKFEFAENPEISIDLIEGDKVSFLSFTYIDPSKTNTIANGYDISITNGGNDVTEYYNINFEETEVEFTPRNITIKLKDQEKVYDGTLLKSSELEETDNLNEEHDIIVSAIGSQKEVGISKNVIDEVKILDKNGFDVTQNYTITKETGELSVIPRDIEIKPEYQEREYDTTPLESKKVDVIGGSLVSNQIAEYEIIGSQVTVGTSESVITSYKIFEDGADVSRNYNIKYRVGELVVKPRNITVVFEDTTKVYDGNNIFKPRYDLDLESGKNLVEGQVIDLIAYSSNQNIGVWSTENHKITIYDGIEDVTDNYKVDYVYGELEITKRPITVRFRDSSKVYDGTNRFKPKYDLDIESSNNLVDGQMVDLIAYSSNQNVGTWTTTSHDIEVYDGNQKVTDNYEIDSIYGEIEITKRPITVEFKNTSKVYDGNNVFKPDYDLDLESGHNLVEGQMVDLTAYSENQNVGTWTTTSHDIEVYDGIGDVTDNYEIDYVYGEIEITKRPITVVFKDTSKVYDGNNVFKPEYGLDLESGNSLVEGQTLDDGSIYSASQNVGTWDTTSHDIKIYDGNEEVADNYDMTPVYGKLIITKRPITVVFDYASKVYDGTNVFKPKFALDLESSNDLVEGQTIGNASIYSSSQNVGTWDTTSYDIEIYDGNEDVTDNYDLTPVYSDLEITKRHVSLVFEDSTKIYDGNNNFKPGYYLDLENGHNLASGQSIDLMAYSSSQNVGIWATTSHDIAIYHGVEEVTDNYQIDYAYGELQITKRPITVIFKDTSKVYDGTNIFKPQYDLDLESGHNLVDGQMVDLTAYSENQIVGTWTTTSHDIEIYDGFEAVTDNYEIDSVYSLLEITKRPITVDFKDTSKVYDGDNIFKPDYGLNLEIGHNLVDGQIISNANVYMVDPNWGDSKTPSSFTAIIMDSNDVNVTENYEISPVYGTFKINKRAITVVFDYASKVYDGTNVFKPKYALNLESGNELVEGQTIGNASIYSPSQTVGTWATTSHDIEIYDGNEDVTDNYDLTPVYSDLEITKRQISVVFEDSTKIYDGNNTFNIDAYNFALNTSLATNQAIDIHAYSSNHNVGIWATTSHDIAIYDGVEEVTGNYQIDYAYGELQITKRPITVVSKDTSKVYDGTNIFKPQYDLDLEIGHNLVDGQMVDLTAYSENQNVGTWTTIDDDIVIYNGNEEVTDNYEIEKIANILEVIPRTITIKSGDKSKQFDGTELRENSYQVDGDGVLSSHTLLVNITGSIINIGKEMNNFDFQILDQENNDISYNYQVSSDYGILEILPPDVLINIKIESGSDSKDYDGTALTYNEWILIGQLLDHHKLEVTVTGKITEVGQTDNDFDFTIKNEDGVNVEPLYDVEKIFGILKIFDNVKVEESNSEDEVLPKIEIISHDAMKQYDGSPLSKDEYYIYGNLDPNHEVVIVNDTEITNIGSIRNRFYSAIVVKDTGEDVSNLYNIRRVYGDLEIVPNNDRITIELKPFSSKKVYDGNKLELNKDDFWIPSRNLPEGYSIDLDFNGTITDAGLVEVSIKQNSIKVFDENGYDVTTKFNIVTYSEVLEVLKREIEVKTMSAEKTYDEEELIHHIYSISKGSLAEGHEIEIVWPDSGITEVGTLDNDIKEVIIRDQYGNTVTENYSISKNIGILEVFE
ncbi:hypothetical protein [Haloplasma contractile]|uniref:Uncharacterized protein n=1 Tax=Haloplasma contractile SSD-17B TaxID=1033810 RepID=U2FFI7_9MOLU|nr:hypothetical protein [Haloplasma contractile]ERJ11680.1 hypothetical protein HLPCO_002381 [Haloplasma contractile SSD-17B]